MKRFLRVGERYALFRNHFKPPTLLLLCLFLIFFEKTTLCANYLAWQSTTDSIIPLQIGDSLPNALWTESLQVINHTGEQKAIQLKDFKGKMILLDFLSTGCKGCIEALPKLESITHEYGPEVILLPITSESRDRMEHFIHKNQHTSSSSLSFVMQDRVLKKYFPHQFISHLIWIDQYGIYRAASGTSHVNQQTLKDLHLGKTDGWPFKTEMTNYFSSPLINLLPGTPNNNKRNIYYGMITGYTEGVGAYIPTLQDSIQGIKRFSLRNRPILDLYLIAVNKLHRLNPEDIILEVADPSIYDVYRADLSYQTREQWFQNNAICYEATHPLHTSYQKMHETMLFDLNRFLNLNGRLEMREGKERFVLTHSDTFN